MTGAPSTQPRPAPSRSTAVLAAIALAALLCGPGAAGAQEAAATDRDARTITYEEAVRLALQRNTTIRRAESQTGLQSSLVTGETMDFLPSLEIGSSGTRTFGRSFSQQEGAILSETSDFFGANLSSSLTLFNGFEQFASLEQAQREEEASRQQLGRAQQDVAFQVLERFATLLQNRELTRVAEQELRTQEELLKQVRGLVDVGRQPQSDLYQQQAARAEARAALEEARRQEEVAKTELIRLLQLDPRAEYDFEASNFPEAAAPDTFVLDRLLDVAMERRSDLQANRAAVEAGRQGVRAARSGYWPSVTLSFGYGSDWSSNARRVIPGTGSEPRTITITPDGGGEPATIPVPGTGSEPETFRPDFMDQLNTRRGGSVQLSMSVPVFQRWQTRNQVRQAEVQLDNARYDLTDQQQTVALEVRQALVDYRSSQAQLDAAEERLEAARRARDAAQRRYELGAATFVEVSQAISGFVSARSAEVQARYALVRARELIDYQTGRLTLRPGSMDRREGP